MNSEKYNKIVKCTLKGIACNYIDSYVLVKNIDDLDSELNVDIKGLCFNTDYKIENIENVIEINSLDELYEFCKSKEIWIDNQNITKVGLLVGADNCFLILKELNAYGWISEDYIENDKQREEILNKIEEEMKKENQKNIEEEMIENWLP